MGETKSKTKKIKTETNGNTNDIVHTTTHGTKINLKTGQKYPTPTPGHADRVFYESLFEQNPNSFMAMEYCINYGILDEEIVAKIYSQYIKLKAKVKANGGMLPSSGLSSKSKSSSKSSTGTTSIMENKKSKKRKVVVDMDDAMGDTGFDDGNAYEGVGTIGF